MLITNKIPFGLLLSKIKFELVAIIAYSSAVGILDHHSYLEETIVPLTIPTLLGTSLSLLLAFRINQSYDRWWEARIIWGAIVNDSRSLIRQVKTFVSDPQDETAISFARRQAAWCHALGESLRRLPHSAKVKEYSSDFEHQSNIPNALLLKHSEEVRQLYQTGWINPFQQIQIDSTITRLVESMGKCERIKNTIFPGNYSTLLHFLILIFVTLLPLGLTDYSILMEVALTTLFAGIFFLIEKTAIFMQDPFENMPTDTPMTTLANNIEVNLMQMVSCPPPTLTPPTSYYQL
ncbi:MULTISPECIES: bestrophin family protein [Hymenobacteraceae]|uniref:Bestrophin family ion channel n=1 Tax=Nibribacter koreensis TaxID=1084519 RepID=A0ABP8G3B0_9BACT|nr:bestrophin family ion channel [Rufibacter sp. DG15C]AMM50737.1 membrane protein [Rufibacter sp. DG15C]